MSSRSSTLLLNTHVPTDITVMPVRFQYSVGVDLNYNCTIYLFTQG